jgi:uncharacterized lipoprotein NlpE involved in copper resistance
MTPRLLLAALFASTLAVSGCKPSGEAAAPAAPADETAAQPAADDHATDVVREVDNASAPEGLDMRAFAGSFEGTVPCADCPGIDTALELFADGSARLDEQYRDRKHETGETGTWTVEEHGKRIRFDPDSKDAEDRVYAVTSNDELRMVDRDGNPIDGDAYALVRAGKAK